MNSATNTRLRVLAMKALIKLSVICAPMFLSRSSKIWALPVGLFQFNSIIHRPHANLSKRSCSQ